MKATALDSMLDTYVLPNVWTSYTTISKSDLPLKVISCLAIQLSIWPALQIALLFERKIPLNPDP